MIETMAASRLLSGFDEGGAEYIEKFSQSVAEKIQQGSAYSLSDAVERGLSDGKRLAGNAVFPDDAHRPA